MLLTRSENNEKVLSIFFEETIADVKLSRKISNKLKRNYFKRMKLEWKIYDNDNFRFE